MEGASQEQILLTSEGRERLQSELDHLRSVKRPQLAEQLRVAIEAGDLSENVGYEDAKHEQALLEGRILTLETLLKKAVIVDDAVASERVVFGSRVTVMERGRGEQSFRIVGSAEVDPRNGRISNESPVGKALLDHRVGDEVAIETPDGVLCFEILDIQ